MASWAARQAIADMNNPNSIYYIGGPSISEQIQNVINGGGYKTNYFGSAAKGILVQPNSDCVQFTNKAVERKRFKEKISMIGTCAAALLGVLIFRKIPGSGTVLSVAGKALTLPFKGIKYLGKAIAWLCKASKI